MLNKIKIKLPILLIKLFYWVVSFLPLHIASIIGYFIGYYIISNVVLNRKKHALMNIKLSFPEKNHKEILHIYKQSCANFGAILFELPAIDSMESRINIIDPHNMLDFIYNNKTVVFSAHTANWEIYAFPFIKKAYSYAIYKKINNKEMDNYLRSKREQHKQGCIKLIPANKEGLIFLSNELKKNLPVTISLPTDQKAKEGILVDFFGRPALYPRILQFFTLKYNLPIIPLRVIRKKNCTFDIIIEKPLIFQKTNDSNRDIYELTKIMNSKIEEWVREYPSQWFWLHRRWSKTEIK